MKKKEEEKYNICEWCERHILREIAGAQGHPKNLMAYGCVCEKGCDNRDEIVRFTVDKCFEVLKEQ